MALQIKAVPTITWGKAGHNTIAMAEVEIVDSALPANVIETITISPVPFNEKNHTPAEIEEFFRAELEARIETALSAYKAKVAADAAHKTDIEDKVQVYLNANVDLESIK